MVVLLRLQAQYLMFKAQRNLLLQQSQLPPLHLPLLVRQLVTNGILIIMEVMQKGSASTCTLLQVAGLIMTLKVNAVQKHMVIKHLVFA